MLCPTCKGYLWTEQERAGGHRECAERYGLDVVCIAGHRFTLTPEDFKKYIRSKKKRSALNKDAHNG